MSDLAVRLSWTGIVYELSKLMKAMPNTPPLYLVGGAVRDAYLRGAIGDIDVAVAGDAIAVARFVADAWKADIYIMDRERDVARVFVTHEDSAITIDFAKLRGATLEDDLRDRDFTMNAMAADLLGDPGALLDPLKGVADLRRKVLRRCSPRAIANDPIRALRAVRLSAQFNLRIHPDTAADIRRNATAISKTSPERVRDEFFKLLALEKAARGLRVLAHMGVLAPILPLELDGLDASLAMVERMSVILAAISSSRTDNTAAAFDLGMLVIQLDRFRGALQNHLEQVYGNGRTRAQLLVLAALLSGQGAAKLSADAAFSSEPGETSALLLRLTRAESRVLSAAARNSDAISERENWRPLDQHRFWYRQRENGIDAVLLGAANVLGRAGGDLNQADWLKYVERSAILLDAFFNRYDTIVSPRLLLDGNDVQALLDIGRGPRIGRILTRLREAQAVGDISSLAEAREFAKRVADGSAD